MSEAKKILEMIEAVDPDDSDMLDEIDARVWCFLNKKEYKNHELIYDFMIYPYSRLCINKKDGTQTYDEHLEASYTKSRDDLKAIRPEGWLLDIEIDDYGGGLVWTASLTNLDKEGVDALFFPTEELAELHAIIQAIDFERKNEEKYYD